MRKKPVLVLDTHAWIWLNFGDKRLSSQSRLAIEDSKQLSLLRISLISLREVGMLYRKGRINLVQPLDVWLRAALSQPGIQLAPLTPEIVLDSCLLPGNPPGDPADQLIIATTRAEGGILLTADSNILSYSRQGHLRTMVA